MMGKTRLFRKGTYLAVLAEGEGFWICWTKSDVYLEKDTVSMVWMEKFGENTPSTVTYERMSQKDKMDLASVITKVTMIREVAPKTGKVLYRLPEKEKLKVESRLSKLKEGYTLNAYEKENETNKTSEVLLMEIEGEKPNRKRKLNNVKAKKNRTGKEKKMKKTNAVKIKKIIDKSNPNRTLKPNHDIKVWTKDPLFETNEDVPFVSSLGHSKLAIRAVLTNNMKLLEDCKKNTKQVHSMSVMRSLGNDMTALKYALKTQNMAAVKVLVEPDKVKNRSELPACLLSTQGTGTYNYRTLGIRNIRRLNMSRGAREGNNAFIKDQSVSQVDDHPSLEKDIMHWNLPIKFVKNVCLMSEKKSSSQSISTQALINNIYEAVRYGNREMAAHFIERDLKQGSSSFSHFYQDALLETSDPWDGTVREVSARKKGGWENKQITPLHCACINPSTGPLEALFKVCPDLYIADSEDRKLVHYAAACEDVGPLKFLVEKGANLEDPDRNGQTPLMIACKVGREKTANFIIEKLSEKTLDEYHLKRFGAGGVDKPGKDTWCPLHIAVAEENYAVTNILLQHGAKPDKPLSTRYDKITPLMIAAANADLDMVKLLIDKNAKIEKYDRYKRTALTHAVINGSANVASYLLSLGADPNKLDSSKNSNLHYACAYGWWFCMRVLIDAGALIDALNEWSLTPLGIAIMKSNKGIVDHLITLPGIDINMQDEKGRTILLKMLVDQKNFSAELLKDIQGLVNKYGADPKLTDNEGKNPLHYIAMARYENEKKENTKQLKVIHSITTFLLDKGVSALQADEKNNIPLVYVMSNQFPCLEFEDKVWHNQSYKTGNIELMKQLLGKMKSNWPELDHQTAKESVQNLMLEFVDNISLIKASEYLNVFYEIMEFITILKKNGVLQDTTFMDEVNQDPKKPLTIFSRLCEHYSEQKVCNDGNMEDVPAAMQDKCWNLFSTILDQFIIEFKPLLEVKATQTDANKPPRHFSALLVLSKTKQDDFKGFAVIMKYAKNVDVLDYDENTPLMIMIENQEVEHVKSLLQAGALINRLKNYKDAKNDIIRKELPIERALKTGNLEMMQTLLSSGAASTTLALTGVSLLHTAVAECAKNKTKQNLALVKLLLSHGCHVNEKSQHGRTPIHIAVNTSRDDTDASLDLEILLIKHGADVQALDDQLRTPLHYAFVKIKNHTDTSACDPIQIVSILVQTMDISTITQKDMFGCSAFHYAALRGATVCCLLLIKKGSNINDLDNKGNSPLSNAVFGKHDSCALMLLQKNADINAMIFQREDTAEVKKHATDKLWKYLPQHFPRIVDRKPISLFQGIVTNDWLGITYIVLETMEQHGMSFARAIEVAFHIQKLQFAKTLISNQAMDTKLKEIISDGRNLINCLAFETKSNGSDHQKELVNDLFNLLDTAGVDADTNDNFGCSPLHYAVMRKNYRLVQLLLTKSKVKKNINEKDKLGRTPFAAYFWNYQFMVGDKETTENILDLLMENGADPNITFNSKPLSILDEAYNKACSDWKYNDEQSSLDCPTGVSPLIIAIGHRDKKMIQYLIKNGAKVTTTDSLGRSPAMYAMKTNDQAIIDEIMKHQVDMNYDDNFGYGILAHAIALDPSEVETATYDNAQTIKKIMKKDIDMISLSKLNGKSPLAIAKNVAANECGKVISTALKQKYQESFNFPSDLVEYDIKMGFNHRADSKVMMKKKEDELAREKKKKEEEKSWSQEGCTVQDGKIYQDYDILMHKVDVGFGSWGLYNFYRIQIWKEKHKELYVLFTNWGRIDRWSRGQYQNTPYSTPEEAIKEFSKIFKAKSGNDWDEREHFVNKQKKYRIVQAEHVQKIVRPAFEIDLQTYTESQLPFPIQCMLKDITDVSMLKSAYDDDCDIDTATVPFERIKDDAIKEAYTLLGQINPLVKKREKLDAQKYKVEAEKQDAVLQELSEVLNKICRLSSEYYFLVPKAGYEFEKVAPIDRTDLLEEEKKRLEYLLEFETSKSMILGAMLKKAEKHPLDYIFSSLNCKIELMEESCQEAQNIMRYMYRSNGAHKRRVEGIFRIQSEQERNKFSQASKPKNRKLLWHGTKLSNMMSILSKGMIVDAPYAEVTGRSFGNGVYFADIFDKSYNYSGGLNRGGQYMLLCDVALGKCKQVESTDWKEIEKAKKSFHQFDSLQVLGQNVPDEKLSLKTKGGYIIPVGKIVPRKKEESQNNWCWNNLDYSEYVVYRPENIVIRYIIKIGDGDKEYSQQDLFMKKQKEVVSNGPIAEEYTNGNVSDMEY